MNLSLTDVVIRIKNIIKNRFGIDIDSFKEDISDKEFLGKDIGMGPRDLVYLFSDIENEFEIKIPQEPIVEGRFNTFNHVVDLVMNVLAKKEEMAV
jgi:acyl carrier protein